MPLKDLLKAREFLFELNAPSAGLCYICWAHIHDIFMLLSILTHLSRHRVHISYSIDSGWYLEDSDNGRAFSGPSGYCI